MERRSCPEYIKIKKNPPAPAVAIAFVISAATADAATAVAAAMPSLFQHIKET